MPPITGEALEVYERAILLGVGQLRRAVGAPQRRRVPDPEGAALRHAARQRRAAEGHREGGREEGHRDRALRDSARRVHVDGAHGLGHHAAPAAPDGRRRRRAVRGARWSSAAWSTWCARSTRSSSRRSAARSCRPRRCPRWLSRARALAATRSPRRSTRGSAAGCRAWSTARPRAETSVAEAVRVDVRPHAPTSMDDDEAIDRVLNPARNRYRLEVMNVSYHSPLMRALHHPSLHVREAPEPHRRLAGPAPPDGAGRRGR